MVVNPVGAFEDVEGEFANDSEVFGAVILAIAGAILVEDDAGEARHGGFAGMAPIRCQPGDIVAGIGSAKKASTSASIRRD